MTITRREICLLFPAIVPAAAALNAFTAEDIAMPSAHYSFDELPMQILDHAELRRVLKGKLATGETLEIH